jgi:hypothetical protein
MARLALSVFIEYVFGRGLHSSTFRLNVSAFYGIGGALRDYLGVVLRVLRSCRGVLWGVGCMSCQIRLRLS